MTMTPAEVMARARAISSLPLQQGPLAELLRRVDPAEPYFHTRTEAWASVCVRAVSSIESIFETSAPGLSPMILAAIQQAVVQFATEADRLMDAYQSASVDEAFGPAGTAHAAVGFYRLAASMVGAIRTLRNHLGDATPARLLETLVDLEAVVGRSSGVPDTAAERPSSSGSGGARPASLSSGMRRNGLMILGAIAMVTLLGNTRD